MRDGARGELKSGGYATTVLSVLLPDIPLSTLPCTQIQHQYTLKSHPAMIIHRNLMFYELNMHGNYP